MNRNILLAALFGASCLSVQAVDVQDAIKQVKKNNFEKAIAIQKKVLSGELTSQTKLLCDVSEAMLYNNPKFSDYDPLKAYSIYNRIVYSDYITDPKVLLVFREEQITVDGLRVDIEENLLKNAKTQNTIAAYDAIIEACQGCSYLEEAKTQRDNLVFNNTLNGASLADVNKFLADYPNSPKRAQAIALRDSLAYAMLPESSDAYNKYIAAYPNSKYVPLLKKNLEKMAYNEAKESESLNSYAKFLVNFPNSKNVDDIEKRIKQRNEELVWKINPTYSAVKCVTDSVTMKDYILVKDGSWGVLNSTGASIVSPSFDEVGGVYAGLLVVKQGGQWGIANVETGSVVYPISLSSQSDVYFVNDKYVAVNNGGWGLVTVDGKQVIPSFLTGRITERTLKVLVNGGVAMSDGKIIKIADAKGNMIVDASYDEVSWRTSADMDSKYIKLRNGVKYGIISPVGNIMFEPMFDMMPFFDSDGVSSVKNLFQEGWIDSTGHYLYNDKLTSYKNCTGSDKMIAYEVNGLFGFLDKEQKSNIPLKYNALGECFTNGMALVKSGNEWQYIDRNGKVLCSAAENSGTTMKMVGKVVLVSNGKNVQIVNAKGDQFDASAYDEIDERVYSDFFIVTKGGKKGAINMAAQEVVPTIYDEMNPYCKNYSVVKQNGKFGLYYKGKLALDPVYDRLIDASHSFESDCSVEAGANPEVLYVTVMNGSDNTKIILKDGKKIFSTPDEVRIVKLDMNYTVVQTAEYGMFTTNSKCALVGPAGEVICKPSFADIKMIGQRGKDIYFSFKDNEGKWGVINSKGTVVVHSFADRIDDYDGSSLIAVKYGDRLVYDQYGLDKLPAGYEVDGQILKNKRTNKYGVIDQYGNIKLFPDYDEVVKVTKSYAVVLKDGKYGIVNYY